MVNTARVYTANYSVSDWESWHDRWELINGMPCSMIPMSSFRHQENPNVLGALLYNQIKTSDCNHCKVTQPIDWQISEDTVVQPDLLLICKHLTTKRFSCAPKLVFEILNPSTEQKTETISFGFIRSKEFPFIL